MPRFRLRPTLLALLAAWLSAITLVVSMLVSAEISRWESHFDDDIRQMVSEVKHKLDTNEAVLAGFSAFLQAVDRSDTESTIKYAAAAIAAYPHIYMIEIARKVDKVEEVRLEQALRARFNANISFKDFSEVTGRPIQNEVRQGASWPILFLYPSLPSAQAILGVRLETVDYLSHTMALAARNVRPVASPAFQMYEGDKAFILLQEIRRPPTATESAMDIFGDTMMTLLLIKAQDLIPAKTQDYGKEMIGYSASLLSPGNPETILFEKMAQAAEGLEQFVLPRFTRQLKVDNTSQPMLITFDRQLLWRDLLQTQWLVIAIFLIGAIFVVPWMTIRHYASLDRAETEYERSAYLATHDLLTGLPNRFLFADRFEHALRGWQRNGQAFALMLADLDHFKNINDLHGHDVGDQVLTSCAKRMAGELRACDTVARHGGDEFVILLANILNAEDGENVGRKILAAISAPIETSAGPLTVSCSIGIAICPTHGATLDILRKNADRAMYCAKDLGRNAVSVFSGEKT